MSKDGKDIARAMAVAVKNAKFDGELLDRLTASHAKFSVERLYMEIKSQCGGPQSKGGAHSPGYLFGSNAITGVLGGPLNLTEDQMGVLAEYLQRLVELQGAAECHYFYSDALLHLETKNLAMANILVELLQQLGSQDSLVLHQLMEYHFRWYSQAAETVLVAIGEAQTSEFFGKLDDYVIQPGSRLRALDLLGLVVKNQGPNLYKLGKMHLLTSIITCLKADMDIDVISSALTALDMLLPCLAPFLAPHLSALFAILCRLIQWRTQAPPPLPPFNRRRSVNQQDMILPSYLSHKDSSDPTGLESCNDWSVIEELRPCNVEVDSYGVLCRHLQTTVCHYFRLLYALFPSHLLTYLQGAGQTQHGDTLMPLLQSQLKTLHANPIMLELSMANETGYQRWDNHVPHDVVALSSSLECSLLDNPSTLTSPAELLPQQSPTNDNGGHSPTKSSENLLSDVIGNNNHPMVEQPGVSGTLPDSQDSACLSTVPEQCDELCASDNGEGKAKLQSEAGHTSHSNSTKSQSCSRTAAAKNGVAGWDSLPGLCLLSDMETEIDMLARVVSLERFQRQLLQQHVRKVHREKAVEKAQAMDCKAQLWAKTRECEALQSALEEMRVQESAQQQERDRLERALQSKLVKSEEENAQLVAANALLNESEARLKSTLEAQNKALELVQSEMVLLTGRAREQDTLGGVVRDLEAQVCMLSEELSRKDVELQRCATALDSQSQCLLACAGQSVRDDDKQELLALRQQLGEARAHSDQLKNRLDASDAREAVQKQIFADSQGRQAEALKAVTDKYEALMAVNLALEKHIVELRAQQGRPGAGLRRPTPAHVRP